MIKELRVNFYRIFRTKSFYVIFGVILAFALLSSFFIFFLADDPTGFMEGFTSALDEQLIVASTESDDEEEQKSQELVQEYFDNMASSNQPTGVLSMLWSEFSVFLMAVFVALFVGGEFKSRFHINRFSLNTGRSMIFFCEWLALAIVGFLVMVISTIVGIALTILFCSNFYWGDLGSFCVKFFLSYLCLLVFMTFAFMIAVFRRASALSIVLSSLYIFEVFHLVYGIVSILNSLILEFSVNNIFTNVYGRTLTSNDVFAYSFFLLGYIFAFLGITIGVSNYRDAC